MSKQSVYAMAVSCYDPELHGPATQYCERLKLNYQSFANKKSQMKKEAEGQPQKERKTSVYRSAVASYDPELHGTAKDYCHLLGLNYQCFANMKCRMKKEAQETGVQAEKSQDAGSSNTESQLGKNSSSLNQSSGSLDKSSSTRKQAQKPGTQAERPDISSQNRRQPDTCQSEKTEDYPLYYQELELTGETIKAFCQRKGLSYNSFRSGWSQYQKEKGSRLTRKEREKENFRKVFNGEKAFLKIVFAQEVLHD